MASDVSPKEIVRAGMLVRIPPALRSYTDGQDEVVLEASNVAAMLRTRSESTSGRTRGSSSRAATKAGRGR